MKQIYGRIYETCEIELDDTQFVNCHFTDGCVLVYRGGALPTFRDCKFESVMFNLCDAAERTVQFLHDLTLADRALVEKFIESCLGLSCRSSETVSASRMLH